MIAVKRLAPVLGALLVLTGAAAACTADEGAVYEGDAAVKTAFDPAVWADEAKVYAAPYPRNQMVADLRQRVLVPGLSRAEVLALLGPATDTEYFAEHGLVYWLGPETGAVSVDSQWLLIDFDVEGRLQSTEVRSD
jgi:hypothetical protein